jgi:hypothetical protein
VAKEKEKPNVIPSLGTLLYDVSPDERIQIESVEQAILDKIMAGRLVTNWCSKCGRWRFQFVSHERAKNLISNETFLCTKCSTPIPLIIDKIHTLVVAAR